ncbi:hypothetical protein Tco_0988903 [Tanacetum coccineum]|uniref:Uncharacterized protein n=1 Tax=Tanacetum coccineum TaxID=301880 RepID=A0ABQ5ESL3_9ASTR
MVDSHLHLMERAGALQIAKSMLAGANGLPMDYLRVVEQSASKIVFQLILNGLRGSLDFDPLLWCWYPLARDIRNASASYIEVENPLSQKSESSVRNLKTIGSYREWDLPLAITLEILELPENTPYKLIQQHRFDSLSYHYS